MGTHDFTEGEPKSGRKTGSEGDRQASRTCGAARQEVGSGGDDDDVDEADADENMRLKLTTKRWCRSEGDGGAVRILTVS